MFLVIADLLPYNQKKLYSQFLLLLVVTYIVVSISFFYYLSYVHIHACANVFHTTIRLLWWLMPSRYLAVRLRDFEITRIRQSQREITWIREYDTHKKHDKMIERYRYLIISRILSLSRILIISQWLCRIFVTSLLCHEITRWYKSATIF